MNFNRRAFVALGGGALLTAALRADADEKPGETTADVCVYGGTASGVLAAVAAAREGCRVVIVEPTRWLGGMTGGGIDAIDWGNKHAVGGTTALILKDGTTNPQYRKTFKDLTDEHKIAILYEHRLGSVKRDGTAIRAIELDHAPPDRTGCPIPTPKTKNALKVSANVFIDCSYEGDLMAKAGVSHTFGREAREQYGESLAGVRPHLAVYDIDPYNTPGNAGSGLIPLLQDVSPKPEGSADGFTMAYCWRWKLTDKPERLPIEPPEEFDPRMFELFRRGFAAHVDMGLGRQLRKPDAYEVAKGNFYSANSSRALIAQSIAGCNADYPAGDWSTRARIWKFHQEFVRGITRFLQTDPVVPAIWKTKAQTVGFKPGVFDDTGGWPHQLYVREARRMKSAYILTQKDLEGANDPGESVGLGSYGVDDWPYATLAVGGKVAVNGGEFSILRLTSQHGGAYTIPYRSITPLANECTNLLVPVCCSASHIAMTSTRMEPVWMILGESAGIAASLALQNKVSVQNVQYAALRQKLLTLNQKLDRLV